MAPSCRIACALLRNRFRKTILRISTSAMIDGQLPETTTCTSRHAASSRISRAVTDSSSARSTGVSFGCGGRANSSRSFISSFKASMRAMISVIDRRLAAAVGQPAADHLNGAADAASGFLTSCAMTAAISPSLASAACSRSCSSICDAGAQVVQRSGELALPADRHLADRQMQREGGAVLPPAHHLPSDADDLRHAGGEVAGEIAIVLLVIRRRHQHVDVLADDLGSA